MNKNVEIKAKEVLNNATKYICLIKRTDRLYGSSAIILNTKDFDRTRPNWSDGIIDVSGGSTLEQINDFIRPYLNESNNDNLIKKITGKYDSIMQLKSLNEIKSDRVVDILIFNIKQTFEEQLQEVSEKEMANYTLEQLADKCCVDEDQLKKVINDIIDNVIKRN